MSKINMQEIEDDIIIPISEWPVSDKEISVDANLKLRENDNTDTSECPQSEAKFTKPNISVRSHELKFLINLGCKKQKICHSKDPALENLASVRVAKWQRKNNAPNLLAKYSLTQTSNPNTKLFHISRTKECQHFLNAERSDLLQKLEINKLKKRGDIYAALASIEDWLENYERAMEYIQQAVAVSPDNREFMWLLKKLEKQCKVKQVQTQQMEKINSSAKNFPQFEMVERISSKDLTVKDFADRYLHRRKPVIIEDYISEITKSVWDFDLIKSRAGNVKAMVKRAVAESVEWACLEDSQTIAVAEFIEAVQRNETSDYLFDWSLPLHCPHLAAEFILPKYFEDNFLLKTEPGSLYHDSWPSLFIAPSGVNSNLHVDAFASNFWMVLFLGQKRWTIFEADDAPLLYPVYFHSMDPVFGVDLSQPDLQRFPLLALTKPKQCILNPGDLLFVPSGSPHYVENLTATLAISSNHVGSSNYQQVCEELKINSLKDTRSQDLLDQLDSLIVSKQVDL